MPSPDRGWWLAFACLCILGSLWALASPLFSSQDEPSHVIRAAAVARGQLGGEEFQSKGGGWNPVLTSVSVPKVFAQRGISAPCYAFRPDVPASCAPPLDESVATVETMTTFGRYPPAYYLAVGLPSLVFRSEAGIYLMRLVSVGISAALLASAFTSARASRTPTLVLGVAMAATPMVLFLAGSVNSSSMEIAGAIALWAALASLVLGGVDVTARSCARLVVAGAALMLSRPLSPLWALLIVAVVVAVADKGDLWRLAGSRLIRRSVVWLSAAFVLACSWMIARNTLGGIASNRGDAGHDLVTNVQLSLGKGTGQVLQMIGVFGWADTYSPWLTYLIWFVSVGFLVLLALAVARTRSIAVLVGLIGLTVLLPAALESLSSQTRGFGWFGRYTLPLAVGIPLLASVFADSALRTLGRRLGWMIATLLAAAHTLAFAFALRRYSVGVHYFGPSEWSPPIPALVLAIAFPCVIAGFAWVLQRQNRAQPSSGGVDVVLAPAPQAVGRP